MALVEHRRDNTPVRYEGTREVVDHGPAPMDIRLPLPLLWVAVAFVLAGMFISFQLTGLIGGHVFTAEVRLLGVKLDSPSPRGVEVTERQMQSILQLVQSDAYLYELARRSGVEPDLDRLQEMISGTRPRSGAVLLVVAAGPNQEEIAAMGNQLVPTLDVMIDRVRAGSLTVLDENGRNPFAGQEASYTGPLYVDPFDSRPDLGQGAPPATTNMYIGAVLGLLVMFMVALGAHARPRVTSAEDLGSILGVPQAAKVPRLGFRPKRRVEHYLKGLALSIDGTTPHGVGSLGLLGTGIPRTRANLATTVAAGMVATLERNVVLVDLDIERGSLSRRLGLVRWFGRRQKPGVSDVVSDGLAVEPLVEPVSRRRLPRALRRMVKQSEHQIYAVGVGTRLGDRTFDDEGAVIDAIRRLGQHAVVVVVLPRVPGPAPVQDLLAELDVSMLTILDGWSLLPDAQAAGAVLSSTVAGRAGYLLLEN